MGYSIKANAVEQFEVEMPEAIRREIHQSESAVAFIRVMDDKARVDRLMEKHLQAVEAEAQREGRPFPQNTILEDIATRIAASLEKDNLDVFRGIRAEVAQEDISDVLQVLSPDNSPRCTPYSVETKAALKEIRGDPDARKVFAHQQYMEKKVGLPKNVKPLKERMAEWLDSGQAKKSLALSKHIVLGGALVIAPPVGFKMLLFKALSTGSQKSIQWMLGDAIQNSGQKLTDSVKGFVVKRGWLSQGDADNTVERLNNGVRSATGSSSGRFGLALGAVVTSGIAASMAIDGLSGDDLGTRMHHLWTETQNLFDHAPSVGDVSDLGQHPPSDNISSFSAEVDDPLEMGDPEGVSQTHEVMVENTLSDVIFDGYQAQGVELSADDLYGPGEHTDHPGGLVGMVAEQNGFDDPSLVYPGDSIQFEVGSLPGHDPANMMPEQGEPPNPSPNPNPPPKSDNSMGFDKATFVAIGVNAQLMALTLAEKAASFMKGAASPVHKPGGKNSSEAGTKVVADEVEKGSEKIRDEAGNDGTAHRSGSRHEDHAQTTPRRESDTRQHDHADAPEHGNQVANDTVCFTTEFTSSRPPAGAGKHKASQPDEAPGQDARQQPTVEDDGGMLENVGYQGGGGTLDL